MLVAQAVALLLLLTLLLQLLRATLVLLLLFLQLVDADVVHASEEAAADAVCFVAVEL